MSVGLPIGCQSWRIFLAGFQIIFPGTTDHLDESDSEWFGVNIRMSLILYHHQPDVLQNLAGLERYLTRDAAWFGKLLSSPAHLSPSPLSSLPVYWTSLYVIPSILTKTLTPEGFLENNLI